MPTRRPVLNTAREDVRARMALMARSCASARSTQWPAYADLEAKQSASYLQKGNLTPNARCDPKFDARLAETLVYEQEESSGKFRGTLNS